MSLRASRNFAAGALGVLGALGALVIGCAAPGPPLPEPPPPELLELVRQVADAETDAPFERRTAHVVIDGGELATEARGVAVCARSGDVRLALQLLPTVGGKVLDLRVATAGMRASWPQAGRTIVHRFADGPAPRGLEVFLAASLIESAGVLGPERVLSAQRRDGNWVVELAPRFPGVEVSVTLSPDGQPIARQYVFRRVAWREERGPNATTFAGRSLTVHIEDETREPLDDVPAAMFEVELPVDEASEERP